VHGFDPFFCGVVGRCGRIQAERALMVVSPPLDPMQMRHLPFSGEQRTSDD